MIKKVFLDMDGVLTNFHKGVCNAFDRSYVLDEATRYAFWVDWMGPDVTKKDVSEKCDAVFWEDLEWMHDGKEVLRTVEEAYGKENIFLVTQPMSNVGSWTGKRVWVERMAPDYIKRLTITEVPKALFASPEALLIDDKNENVDEFIAAGGNAILIPRPWNRLKKHKVIPYLEKEIFTIKHSPQLDNKIWEKDASDKEVLDRVRTNIGIRNFHGHPQFYALLDEMAKLHSRKNHDYAGKGNPLRNFYKCKEMGLSPFQGVMVRLSDKWSRLESFMRQGVLEVKNESIKDTLMDNANYSLLAMILLDEETKDKECPENAPQA